MNALGFRLVQIAYIALLVFIELQWHLWSSAVLAFVQADDTGRLWWLAGFGLALLIGWAVRRAL